jgi:hypothetical protein
MTEAEMRRHEWQCNQGRGGPHNDVRHSARGILWVTIGCLSFWTLLLTWVLW